MSQEIKIQDRVRVYQGSYFAVGVVHYFKDGLAWVHFGRDKPLAGDTIGGLSHPKQMRKLKPRTAPREWVIGGTRGAAIEIIEGEGIGAGEAIRVREVKRRHTTQKQEGGS